MDAFNSAGCKNGRKAWGLISRSLYWRLRGRLLCEQTVAIKWKDADLINYPGKHSFDVAYVAATHLVITMSLEEINACSTCPLLIEERWNFFAWSMELAKRFSWKKEDGEFVYERNASFNPVSNVYAGSYSYRDKITKGTFTYKYSVILYRRSRLANMLTEAVLARFNVLEILMAVHLRKKGKGWLWFAGRFKPVADKTINEPNDWPIYNQWFGSRCCIRICCILALGLFIEYVVFSTSRMGQFTP